MSPLFSTDNRGLLILVVALGGLAAGIILTAVIFMRRRRSRWLLMERVVELEALMAAGRALVAAEMDLDALCALIAEQAGQVIDNRTFQVGLFEDDYYEIRYWTIDGQPQPVPQCFDLRSGPVEMADAGGLVGWVRDHKKPLLVSDFTREMDRLPARPIYESASPPRSALFLPLISGGRAIGIVAAQSQRANHFSDQDMRRLTILANQAAAAIANAQLFVQERTRAAHLALVSRIAQQVNAAEDLEELLEQVVNLTCSTFGFHPVTVFGIDPVTNEIVVQACSVSELNPRAMQPAPGDRSSPLRLPMGQGIVGTAVATRRTVVANSAEDDRLLRLTNGLPPPGLSFNTQAEIAIPLIVNNELLGVLDVQSEQIGAFGETEQIVLEALAAEVAGAVYKAQQLAREQQQAWVTTAELQVAEAIGRHDDRDKCSAPWPAWRPCSSA